jgi:acyl carrier protein
MNVEERIKDLMALSFMLDRKLLNNDSTKLEDLGVDSLGVFELVVNIEDEFGIKIEDRNMLNFTTIGETVKGIKDVIDQGLLS